MISFQNFSFRYEESKDFTLRGIDMTVQTGEFILLTGRSGCGKTTLIRSLNGLIPHFYPGEIQGDLLMDGHSLLEMKPSELAGQVGTVFQDPRSQFFMTDTTRELAFGCENLGLPREETIDRIAKAAKELELVNYLNRSIFALSSGEKQQIAIGSVYALGPKVYIFDEPSANLDYAATKRLAEIMGKELSLGMKDDCKEKVDETLKALELSDYRERHPASLSGGQKQRVTIGAAIVKGSPVIYFDEPTSGLDYDSMVRVSKLIEQLSNSGVIVFVVSHDFEFIVRTCTEVVQLDDDGAIQNQRLSPEILKTLSEKYFS